MGDILSTSHAKEADGEIAQGGHDLGASKLADLATIFIEGDITDPVESVFNGPMAAVEGEDAGGICLSGGEAGNAEDGF